MNKYGETLYVQTTDEPIKVLWQFKHFTLARRPVMGRDGIRYQLGLFFNCELETLQEQTQRTLAMIKVRQGVEVAEMQEFAPDMAMPALAFKKTTN